MFNDSNGIIKLLNKSEHHIWYRQFFLSLDLKINYMEMKKIKLKKAPSRYIGDTLASNSNPIKIFLKIYQIKTNILFTRMQKNRLQQY